MKKSDTREILRRTLRRLARRAPLVLCVLAIGAVYLLLSAFGVGGGKAADDPARMDASEHAAQQSSVPAESTEPADASTEPVSTEAVTTEPVTTEPVTTEPATTEAPTEPPTAAPEGRAIYLTFDDGPGKNTEKVLGILDRYGVRATFFTVGYYVDRYPEIAAKITEHGQLIACHSYTHEYDQCYASADAFMEELEKWKLAVQNACGFVPERICVRFPGGSKTPNAKNCSDEIKRRLSAAGIHWFDWNAADSDKYPKGNTKNLPDEEYFWESYKQTIGWYADDPNAQVIFLTHDSENGTVAILPRMIEDLLDKGYTFKTLDQHPEWG